MKPARDNRTTPASARACVSDARERRRPRNRSDRDTREAPSATPGQSRSPEEQEPDERDPGRRPQRGDVVLDEPQFEAQRARHVVGGTEQEGPYGEGRDLQVRPTSCSTEDNPYRGRQGLRRMERSPSDKNVERAWARGAAHTPEGSASTGSL